ncbi:hypothetical protein IWZ00DRAFT_114849 [Phyllosticta capitalensis]
MVTSARWCTFAPPPPLLGRVSSCRCLSELLPRCLGCGDAVVKVRRGEGTLATYLTRRCLCFAGSLAGLLAVSTICRWAAAAAAAAAALYMYRCAVFIVHLNTLIMRTVAMFSISVWRRGAAI